MTPRLRAAVLAAVLGAVCLGGVAAAGGAVAAPAARLAAGAPTLVLAAPVAPTAPRSPAAPTNPSTNSVTVPKVDRSQSLTIILLLTVLSVAPSVLILATSFTKVIVVLSLTRNALGLQTTPPNQVLAGFALILSLMIMSPVLSKMNNQGLQPYLHGSKSATVALHDGEAPLRTFMLHETRAAELETMIKASGQGQPKNSASVSMTVLMPAFLLSELRSAFIIGFVIFLPFLIIDLVVSSTLMAMGMMMMPPALVSLPFKLLLFVMVNGWSLIVVALVKSYR